MWNYFNDLPWWDVSSFFFRMTTLQLKIETHFCDYCIIKHNCFRGTNPNVTWHNLLRVYSWNFSPQAFPLHVHNKSFPKFPMFKMEDILSKTFSRIRWCHRLIPSDIINKKHLQLGNLSEFGCLGAKPLNRHQSSVINPCSHGYFMLFLGLWVKLYNRHLHIHDWTKREKMLQVLSSVASSDWIWIRSLYRYSIRLVVWIICLRTPLSSKTSFFL